MTNEEIVEQWHNALPPGVRADGPGYTASLPYLADLVQRAQVVEELRGYLLPAGEAVGEK